jgi:hypothetical protein
VVERDNDMVLHCAITVNFYNHQVASIKTQVLAPVKALSGSMGLLQHLASVHQ